MSDNRVTGPQQHSHQEPPHFYDQPLSYGQFRWYMDGMQHVRDSVMFGIIGIFVLGVVFGPLALSQAKKAEAMGLNATTGRVLGWIGIALFVLWLLFMIAYITVIFLVFVPQIQQHVHTL